MGDSYFKHYSMDLTTLFISLACVKSTNIISGHKITKPFSERIELRDLHQSYRVLHNDHSHSNFFIISKFVKH